MTTSSIVKRLSATSLFAAALACAALPGAASAAEGTIQPSTCRKPEYPRESLRRGEEGVSMLGFLIRADGKVDNSVVFSSSGSPKLDEATQEALSKCMFKPTVKDGKPVEAWVQVPYIWIIEDDPGLKQAVRDAAAAAAKGDVEAYYRVARMLSAFAKTDADRERALTVLLSAAELGQAHAQFEVGRRYEDGSGVEAKLEEAMRWYQKAAAQGDQMAIQRLKMGFLP